MCSSMAVVIVTSNRLGQLLLVLLVTLLLFDQVGLVSSEQEEDSGDNIEECGEETVDCESDLLPGKYCLLIGL